MSITIIGAGLAGSEAAWQLAKRGHKVRLVEMRPANTTAAHKSDKLAELVCSNSLGSDVDNTAPGLLKREMNLFGSLVITTAYECRVPAGGALAVDRHLFADKVTEVISCHPNITLVREEATELVESDLTLVCSGPLTSSKLASALGKLTNEENLYFYDAAAPIVTGSSINYEQGFWAARYDKGTADYFNCPMTEEQYQHFWTELVSAEQAPVHEGIDEDIRVFEGCMPIEIMANRGEDTLRFGPLKPVGLIDENGARHYAVVQLRKENTQATLFNLVGFQTRLKWGEQKRIFRMIPALENAEFVRFGVMHRNTYINSPKLLSRTFQLKTNPNIFFAGQITGVEGYVESAASGLIAGINAHRLVCGQEMLDLPEETMLGALSLFITTADPNNFQPMGANFGLLPPLPEKIRDKQKRKAEYARRALEILAKYANNID